MAKSLQSAGFPLAAPGARVLGDDFAPPRQIYFAFIPTVLALFGIMAWTMGDELGLVLATTVATAVALFTLFQWLFCRAPTRFSTLMGMTLLLGYGAGTLNTWLTLPRSNVNLADVVGLTDGILARGMAGVLLSSAALYFLGEIFEKPVFGRDFRFQIGSRTRALIYTGTLAMLAGYATHSLVFEGTAGGGGHASKLGLFLSWLYAPLTAITMIAFLSARDKGQRILCGGSALILLAMFSVLGRRVAIYTTVEVLFVLGLSGFRWREKLLRNVLLVLGLGAIMIVSSLTFMLLRMSTGGSQHATVLSRIQVARKTVQKGGVSGAYALAGQVTRVNFQSRTFVLAFLANILDCSSRMTPAFGGDAWGQIQQAIPHVLYPDKPQYFAEEELVDSQFQLGYGDQPNSILTAGATDFGLMGMIVYPLIIIFVLRVVFNFLSGWLSYVPLLLVVFSFIYLMLLTEDTLTGYCEVIRDSFVFGSLIAVFIVLPAVRLRSSEWKAELS